MVHFQRVHVSVDGQEETSLAASLVSYGMHRGHVGFLPRYHIMNDVKCDVIFGQVTEFLTLDHSNKNVRKKFTGTWDIFLQH